MKWAHHRYLSIIGTESVEVYTHGVGVADQCDDSGKTSSISPGYGTAFP